jgi:hypothetical protein
VNRRCYLNSFSHDSLLLLPPFALVLLLLPKQINLLLYEILARLKAALFRLYNELQMQTRYEKSVKEKQEKKSSLSFL